MTVSTVMLLISSAMLLLLGIRNICMGRTIRLLEEENFDLRFQIEVLERRNKGLVEVHPFKGPSP